MSLEQLGITVLWIFLYGYLIVASIDFGAGFYAYYGKVIGIDTIIAPVISRYLSPVWEVTNVFLYSFSSVLSVFSRILPIIMELLYLSLGALHLFCSLSGVLSTHLPTTALRKAIFILSPMG